jgi:hypothetical protein
MSEGSSRSSRHRGPAAAGQRRGRTERRRGPRQCHDGSPNEACLPCTSAKVGRRDGPSTRWRDEGAAADVAVRLLADPAGVQVRHATVAGGSGRLLDARVVQVQAIVGIGRSRC